jgi:hypothetical protein
MFFFWDYLYYGIYKMYKNSEDSGAEFGAVCAVSGLQSFNILSILMLYSIFIQRSEEFNIPEIVFIGTFFVLVVLNYIRYIRISKFGIDKIQVKWDKKGGKSKINTRVVLSGYALISTAVFFGLIFYYASKKT